MFRYIIIIIYEVPTKSKKFLVVVTTQDTQAPSRRRYAGIIGTLRSVNGDVHENVAEKQSSHHFKLFRDYPDL